MICSAFVENSSTQLVISVRKLVNRYFLNSGSVSGQCSCITFIGFLQSSWSRFVRFCSKFGSNIKPEKLTLDDSVGRECSAYGGELEVGEVWFRYLLASSRLAHYQVPSMSKWGIGHRLSQMERWSDRAIVINFQLVHVHSILRAIMLYIFAKLKAYTLCKTWQLLSSLKACRKAKDNDQRHARFCLCSFNSALNLPALRSCKSWIKRWSIPSSLLQFRLVCWQGTGCLTLKRLLWTIRFRRLECADLLCRPSKWSLYIYISVILYLNYWQWI